MALLLVRYGEIALKSKPVRRRMEASLASNIRNALKSEGLDGKVTCYFGRIFVEADKRAKAVLKRVFGIVSFSECVKTGASLEEIRSLALQLARKQKFKTFAVKSRRVGSHPFSSQKINEEIGAAIAGLGKKVDLGNPEKTFFIEVRDKVAYLYTEKIQGQGGFPLGSQGKIAALIEGKKDVKAAWMFMRRGCEVIAVTKTPALVKELEKWAYKKIQVEKEIPEGVLGLVTGDFKKISELRKKHKVPVYCPLSV